MVWSPETSLGYESDKIAAFIVPYTRGKGVDIGCGMRTAWPHFIGIDNGGTFGGNTQKTIQGDGRDLSIFADRSLDFVFSSHMLEDFPEQDVVGILAEWSRVIKIGGHLVLYVPSANLYPKVGEPGANPAHKWNIFPGDIENRLLAATSCGWTQVECEERSDLNEYSLFEVYRKRDDGQFVKEPWQRNPDGKKRCLVIRYGAIGDQIMVSSILPELKKQGWFVTYNTQESGRSILKYDPNIDEWLMQDTDQVPNEQLGPYWETLKTRYDRVINLCESIEGALLTLPSRLQAGYPDGARHRLFNVNYLERTHDIADVPHNFQPKFHCSREEIQWAKSIRNLYSGTKIAWAINGSSPHKVYPWTHVVAKWLIDRTDAHVFLLADPGIGRELQDGILMALERDGADMTRVHGTAGEWDVRKALTFVNHGADMVVGPETGTLNAVCMEWVPKIIYLSHSSEENLTKHWVNATTLIPDVEKCPCYPCHRLHFDWSYCHQDEKTNAALCASAISPERVFEAIIAALKKPAASEAA